MAARFSWSPGGGGAARTRRERERARERECMLKAASQQHFSVNFFRQLSEDCQLLSTIVVTHKPALSPCRVVDCKQAWRRHPLPPQEAAAAALYFIMCVERRRDRLAKNVSLKLHVTALYAALLMPFLL